MADRTQRLRKCFTPIVLGALLAVLASADAHSAATQPRIEGAPAKPRIVLATFFSEFLSGLRNIAGDFKSLTGIEVEVQGVVYLSYTMWLHARFLGQNPPDVLLLETTAVPWRYGQAGLLHCFDDDIQRPNPLSANPEPWAEAFRTPHIQQSRDTNGHLYLLPYTQYGVGFFYNRDVYDELGLQPPATWDALIRNLEIVRDSGRTAFLTAVKPDDAQTTWIASMLLECFLRCRIPDVNLRTENPDWTFDPWDRANTLAERIDLTESVIAFELGVIDPAKAPEFAETARLVKEMSRTWRPDFLSLSGEEIYKDFAANRTVHMMNGTWFLGEFEELQQVMREVAPEKAFRCATFPFPEAPASVSRLVRAGGINQNAGMRACLMLPRQEDEPWRREAGRLLCWFLTLPEVARKVFAESAVYDIPALRAVEPKPEAFPLLPRQEYAFLPVANIVGYDAQATAEFWPLWQRYLGNRIELRTFLEELSASHRRSLLRQVEIYRDEVDFGLIREALGHDFE